MAVKRELLLIFVLSSFFFAYSENFDLFFHAQRWVPSACFATYPPCLILSENKFIIRGFWPAYKNGTYPTDCNGPKYDPNAITDDVSSQLAEYWPNPYGPNEDAWKEAWNRNGKCSASKLNQTKYFTKALKIPTEYNILNILRASGVVPNSFKLVPIFVVQNVIQRRLGVTPGLRCKFSPWHRGFVLKDVVLCVESDATTLMDCPDSDNDNCPYYFIFPGGIGNSNSNLLLPTDV